MSNIGDHLRRVRKDVLDEHHSYYLAPTPHPHGLALLRMLIRYPCGHVRWVIDWQACKPCWVCLSGYHGQRIDELLASIETEGNDV